MLESADYVEAVRKLRPDIVLGLGDVVVGGVPGQRRKEKMGDRTQLWVKEMVDGLNKFDGELCKPAFFAPILPLAKEQQLFYLQSLTDDLQEHLSGLLLYETDSIVSVPDNISDLPRLCIEQPDSPHKILHDVALGIDMLTIPFIGAATDAGIALDFSFPPVLSIKSGELLPLGVDMWAPENATNISSLRLNCNCYACTNHHCAFVQHLLSAKEMLGWVLLQLHNHHIMDEFFAGIRKSIIQGSFHHDKSAFTKIYEPQLPVKTGQGPRSAIYRFLRRRITHQLPG